MSDSARDAAVIDALLAVHGRTFAEDVGIDLAADDADSVFSLLVTAILMSARIGHQIAVAAARALFGQGWTSPQALAGAGWQARTSVLNESGYARYDESTSRMLGDTCEIALERYGGDLRALRREADGDVDTLREAVKRFKGIGDVGADIFTREVQAVWTEFAPFVDDRARQAAADLDLPRDPAKLSRLADGDTARLDAALIRVALEGDAERIRRIAAGDEPAPVDPDRDTKTELYQRASELDVSGRSSMRKDELAEAIEAAQQGGAPAAGQDEG